MAGSVARSKDGKIKSMEITPHGKEGFTVVHHHEQNLDTRGSYKEPKTHVMKGHGELMKHVHDHMSEHGSKDVITGEADCPVCGDSKSDKDDEKEEEA